MLEIKDFKKEMDLINNQFKKEMDLVNSQYKAAEKQLLEKHYHVVQVALKDLGWNGKRIIFEGKPVIEHKWQVRKRLVSKIDTLLKACEKAMTELMKE